MQRKRYDATCLYVQAPNKDPLVQGIDRKYIDHSIPTFSKYTDDTSHINQYVFPTSIDRNFPY